MPRCREYAKRTRQVCKEYKDQGYNKCKETRDNGYNECSNWVRWLRWICLAWTWVSNIVCVAWYWVSNIVCVAYSYVTEWICVAWDIVTTIVGAIIETVESIVGWILSAIAWVVKVLFFIPYLGRLLRWIWNTILTVWWGWIGIIDAILCLLGIRPEKKLRICTILLSHRDSRQPVTDVATVVSNLQAAIDIFREEANVRIIPVAPFHYSSGLDFASDERASEQWVRIPKAASDVPLEVKCDAGGFAQDLGPAGSAFEATAASECFYGNFRSVVGYGAPITVFVVLKFPDPETSTGCSQGWVSDYITVAALNLENGQLVINRELPIAHELGHSCNLWHVDNPNNLMYSGTPGRSLKWWQVVLIRNSRHVTYF